MDKADRNRYLNEYLLECANRRIAELVRDIAREQKELDFLLDYKAGKYPEAYLTTESMDDRPIILFPGDQVLTKYGDEVVIDRFDRENHMIYFKDHSPLGDHRIISVIRRAN